MTSKELNQWRTVGLAALGIAALTGGLWLTGIYPAASGSYPAFCGGVGACVAAVAVKAWKQHQANAEKAP